MQTLKAFASFIIPGPSPVDTVFMPNNYSDYSMRGITGTITHKVGQFNLVFTTNMRLDESKSGKVTSLTPEVVKSPENTLLRLVHTRPTQIWQPLNAGGYNWQITVVILLNNSMGITVDFPVGGIKDLSIKIEWDCKPN